MKSHLFEPDPTLEAWRVDEELYPDTGTPAQQLEFLVRYAVLAPSVHNTQPWRFRLLPNALELLADRDRAVPVVDPEARLLTISCGAALMNLRIAARNFGRQLEVETFPEPRNPDILAEVRLGAHAGTPPADYGLFEAIPRWRTHRHRFEDRTLQTDLVTRLIEDAKAEGAHAHLMSGDERLPLVDLVTQGDRIQMANPAFRRELADWLRSNTSEARDGVRGYGIGAPDLLSYAAPLVLRTFDMGGGRAAIDRELALGSPTLAVLGTSGDTRADWLATGQALQRMLLRATMYGVSVGFLGQAVEVPALRKTLADRLGHGHYPQLLLRLGYGHDVKPEPRRPAKEVTIYLLHHEA